jgi:hypothetical protein
VLNVQRTVKHLINVGAKGCFLEDQRWPKRVGHMRNKEVISMEEFAGKVRRLAGKMVEFAGQVRRFAGKMEAATCSSVHGRSCEKPVLASCMQCMSWWRHGVGSHWATPAHCIT